MDVIETDRNKMKIIEVKEENSLKIEKLNWALEEKVSIVIFFSSLDFENLKHLKTYFKTLPINLNFESLKMS